MPDKCIMDPERDCQGRQRAEEVAREVMALDRRLDDFQSSVSDSNTKQGIRIGKLEAYVKVMEERHNHINEKLNDITRDMKDFKQENKDSIDELRKEHKESMSELKKGNKEILDALSPMKHKVEDLEHLEQDVEKLKAKPANTWESIKGHAISWAVVLVLAIVAFALGLGKYM